MYYVELRLLLQFKWYTSHYAVPEDPVAFFNWFFKQQHGWGLSMYEQDWMCTEYDGVTALQENVTIGDLWLKGMAEGAGGSGRTVQYVEHREERGERKRKEAYSACRVLWCGVVCAMCAMCVRAWVW